MDALETPIYDLLGYERPTKPNYYAARKVSDGTLRYYALSTPGEPLMTKVVGAGNPGQLVMSIFGMRASGVPDDLIILRLPIGVDLPADTYNLKRIGQPEEPKP